MVRPIPCTVGSDRPANHRDDPAQPGARRILIRAAAAPHLVLAASAARVVSGGGLASVDRLIARRLRREAEEPARGPALEGARALEGAAAKIVAASEQSRPRAA